MSGFVRVLEMEAEERDRLRQVIHAWISLDLREAVEKEIGPGEIESLVERIMGTK